MLAGSEGWQVNSVDGELLTEYDLSIEAYPNPFNSQTELSFDIPFDGMVGVNVYDIAGRLVETVLDRKLKRGRHNGTVGGRSLASRVYFVNLSVANGEKRIDRTVKVVYMP